MINLVVATQAEAEPVISRLKLRKTASTLNCFRNDDVHLVICGIGKNNTAMACGWLANKTMPPCAANHSPIAWLNFGIAGHLDAEIGTAFLAHKITEPTTGKVWFPHPLKCSIRSSDLITVDRPLASYRPDQLHDMEASAFAEATRKFSDAELVQSLKVVSDNTDHPITEVNTKLATRMIAENIEQIFNCITALTSICDTLTRPEDTISNEIMDHWHFSVSQNVMLERLLQRHTALLGPLTEIPDTLVAANSSKEVLAWLQAAVDSADCSL